MNNQKNVAFPALMVVLFAILAGIKVFGGVAMSWWLVASPLLFLLAGWVVALLIFVSLLILAWKESK